MEIYLLKENLKPGLNSIERVASKSITLPILENVLISTDKNFLTLTATNLENTVIFKTLSKIEKEGKALVSAKLFSNIIKSLKPGKICIEKKGNNLVITGDNEKMQLRCQDAEEFPIIPKTNIQKVFNLSSLTFISGVNQVINTVSSSFNKPELSGVYFNISNKGIVMASTDSFRLSEKRLEWSQEHNPGVSGEYSFIAPPKILNDAISFFSETEENELKISLGEGQMVLENQNNPQYEIKFISKLIEGDFPNYQEIIPREYDAKAVLNRIDLLNKIRAASILSSRTNEISLSVLPKQKIIELLSQDPDSGEYRASLSGQIEGIGINLGFNWRYLTDGLTNIKSQEVLLEFQKNGGPAVIRPVGDDSYIYVVMPIRSV